jgi:hypothetical protein
LHCLWDLQSLFFNMFTCLSGSQVTSVLGVTPPTLQEYLYSCKQGLLIHQPFEDAEEEFERNNDFLLMYNLMFRTEQLVIANLTFKSTTHYHYYIVLEANNCCYYYYH